MEEIVKRLERLETVVARVRTPIPVEFLDNDQAATFMGLKPATLEIWRSRGEGPHFFKVGRKVMYSIDDLRAWMAARRRGPLE